VTDVLRVLVALDAGANRELVEAAMPTDPSIQVVGLVDGLTEAWATLQETPADLLVIACARQSDGALFMIDGAIRQQSDRPIVVLSEGSTNGFVDRAFEAGADDFLALPQPPGDVLFALQKALARKKGLASAGGAAVAPLICILGPKGGTGKTLTTCNLAVALARAERKVAVVDIDLQFGDVGLSLGLTPERTLYDLAKTGSSLDAEKVEDYLAIHGSGVRVMLAPSRPDQAALVTPEFLRNVFVTLRSSNDFVLVDTPPGFTPEVIGAIDSSSHVCVVGMLDSLSLKNTKLGLETLELMGYSPDRITLLLNRADSRVGITREDVASIIGRQPDVFVPSDREIPVSVNEATPIVIGSERSEAARAFNRLAQLYINAEREARSDFAASPKPSSSLKRLLRGRS
jgi:pilus assembly protein CpaE